MLAEETKFGNYWCTVVLSNNVSPKLVASGRHKINTGETVLYSEREDDQHHQGVVIIFKKGLEKCLIEWKPINSRLIKVRLKVRHINTTIIQCHAPTEDSEEDNKETYEQLQAASWDWRSWWEISMQRLKMTTGTTKGPWREKDVAPWMTMERGYWTSAPPMIFPLEGRSFYTETSTSWPDTPPMEEIRTRLTTW